MKKNLLIAAVVLPLMSVSAQWTQVGGTVKVEPNTLKYVTENYEVRNQSTAINEGNVNVRGEFSTANLTDGSGTVTGESVVGAEGFHNIWNGRNSYGQLIVQNGVDKTNGTVESQYNLPAMTYIAMAFPFIDYSAGEAADQGGIASADQEFFPYVAGPAAIDGYMYGRWEATMWTWNNVGADNNPKDFYFHNHPTSASILDPYLYHGINNMAGNVNGTKSFFGKPEYKNKAITVYPYTMGSSREANNRGEFYGSYVGDVKYTQPTGWKISGTNSSHNNVASNGYGDNISLLGNPYTSNFDLTGNLSNIEYVYIINGNDYTEDLQGTTDGTITNNYQYSTLKDDGTLATGSSDILVIRPHGTFFLRVKDATPTVNGTVNFVETAKTFESASSVLNTSRTNDSNEFYQATLKLYDADDIFTGNELYIFANEGIVPNTVSRYEAYINDFNHLGLYSLQENSDGTVDQDKANDMMAINGINALDYVSQPITIGFKAEGEFTIKTELGDDLLNSSNKFFFEDRQTGEFFEVTPEFEYSFMNDGSIMEDRFFMYWNGTPDVMAVDDVALVSQTRVYKFNKNDFKIRFSEAWNKADVYVYNVLGQLVHTATQVDASQDYFIPLKGQASAYIVKTVGDNGEIATQKIVKK